MGTLFTIYKHFRDFVKWLLRLLLQIQHENNFLTTNKHQQAKVRHFSGISLYHYFIYRSNSENVLKWDAILAPVAKQWRAKDIPSYRSQSKRTKIAIQWFGKY